MRKFTSIMLMLLCAVTTWAQISALTDLSNDKAYLLKNANDMGYAIWKSGNNLTLCGASSNFTDALDATATNNNWQIVSYENNYYLYNLGAQKFAVTQKGATYLTEVPTPIKIQSVSKGFAFNSTNDGYTYMCAAHHLTPPVQWWSASDNGSAWQIIDNTENITAELNGLATIEKYFNSQVNVVFEYYINGKLYYTSDAVAHNINVAPEVPALDYVTIGSTDVETITEDCTVKVTCTENLPFISSTDYNNAIWQVIDMHANENNYTWKYVAQDANVETPVTAKLQTKSLGDEYYWAFVGSLIDGFKIYNKAAGASLTLRKAENGNTASVMSATDDRNVFKLYKSTSSIANSYCFKIDGDDYYINKQNKQLKGWTAKDEGSSCRTFTPASFVLNALGGYESAPMGAVGSYSYLANAENYNKFSTVIAAVKANQYDIDALEALDELDMVASIVASEKVSMAAGYYRIQNVLRNKMIGTNDTNRVPTEIGKSNISQLWNFVATENDGVYYIQNMNQGDNGYMQSPSAGNGLVSKDKASTFKITALNKAQYKLSNGGEDLVIYGGGSIGHWWNSATDGDGAWYLVPATSVEVTINEFASICLPFAVETPAGVKAYSIEDTNSTHAILTEKADIPANQGAILAGNGTKTFTIISEATSDWSNNKLSGTTVNTYIAADAYVLAKGDNGIGLYKAALNCDETGAEGVTHFLNNANKAYFAPSTPSGIASYSFNFDWAGTTGIEGVVAEGAQDGAIYDITGRRVKAITAPGIYIVNGRKVVK